MHDVIIVRLEETSQGALGVMVLFGVIFCFTLEPDSNDPEKFIVQAGEYRCRRFHGVKWRNTFEIIVPGHTAILFHAGNVEADTDACVLLGSTTGKLKGDRAVLNSGATFKAFLNLTQQHAEFELLIEDRFLRFPAGTPERPPKPETKAPALSP